MTDDEFDAVFTPRGLNKQVRQANARLDALESDLRRAETYIRHLYWALTAVASCLTVAIVCVALFATGYLPR